MRVINLKKENRMRQFVMVVVMAVLGGSLALAGPSKEAKKHADKYSMKGAPTAATVEKAEAKAEYRKNSTITTEIAGGKGQATFVPAELKHMDAADRAKGVIIGKLDVDHDSNEIEAG